MDPKKLDRLMLQAIGITGATALVLLIVWDFSHAWGFGFGGLWCAINLWVWKGLMKELFNACRFWMVFAFLFVKVPILFGIGFWVLYKIPFAPGAALLGFLGPFFLIITASVLEQFHKDNLKHNSQSTVPDSSVPRG